MKALHRLCMLQYAAPQMLSVLIFVFNMNGTSSRTETEPDRIGSRHGLSSIWDSLPAPVLFRRALLTRW